MKNIAKKIYILLIFLFSFICTLLVEAKKLNPIEFTEGTVNMGSVKMGGKMIPMVIGGACLLCCGCCCFGYMGGCIRIGGGHHHHHRRHKGHFFKWGSSSSSS